MEYTNNIFYVDRIGRNYVIRDTKHEVVSNRKFNYVTIKKAYERGGALQEYVNKNGKTSYRVVNLPMKQDTASIGNSSETNAVARSLNLTNTVTVESIGSNLAHFIHHNSLKIKPANLKISDVKWKHLVRAVLRGKNLMFLGESGSGKTQAAMSVADVMGRQFFYFNLGSTQDPRSTLIGNTHYDKDKGTYFVQSEFVKAIQQPNAVILLDEYSRIHPEGENILMSVLDEKQRYLRIDESNDTPVIKVADGVCFIATANVGTKYTSTRPIDWATMNRFIVIEMELLGFEDEFNLLKERFPNAPLADISAIAEIAVKTRTECANESGRITNMISTRLSLEAASMSEDGFTLNEIAQEVWYPYFSDDGGVESERTYIKQIVQKYQKDINNEKLYQTADFNSNSSIDNMI